MFLSGANFLHIAQKKTDTDITDMTVTADDLLKTFFQVIIVGGDVLH